MFATGGRGQDIKASWMRFQSLSGVLGVCNGRANPVHIIYELMFQSLSGVLGVCNDVEPEGWAVTLKSFNPFQGF